MDLAPAVEALGEEIIAECATIPAGLARDIGTAAAGGAAGVSAGAAEVARLRKDRVTPGGHNGDLHAVLGDSQLAFFETKRSILQRKSLGRLLLQTPIADAAACDFSASRMGSSEINLQMRDDTTYPLQVARVHGSRGEAFCAALTERLEA